MISLSTEASAAAAALGLGMLLGCGESSAEAGSEAPAPTTENSGFGGGFSMVDDIGGIGNSACLTEIRQGEQLPLDLYIMFDMSCSMNCDPSAAGGLLCCTHDSASRLNPLREAVGQFLTSPETAGIGAGLGYFGHLDIGATSCDPADYTTPAVPIGRLPDQAGPIIDSLQQIVGVGETPTGAAIRGACTYARSWKQQNASHLVTILLVTDGIPEAPRSCSAGSCCPDIRDAMAAAQECAVGAPQVATYVLGVGANLAELTSIAHAAGTETAYLVEGGSVAEQVLDALNTIRGTAQISCEFQIPAPPSGETLDYQAVNVEYTPPGEDPEVVYYVEGRSECDAMLGGWYYDNPVTPTTLELCPSTCEAVSMQAGGRIDIALGCETIRPPA